MSKEAAFSMLSSATPPTTSTPEAQSPTPSEPQALQSTPFSHLAKKEAELVKQRQEFKKEQETWAQERQRLSEAKKQYEEFLDLQKKDPFSAYKLLGGSETDFFNYMANQQPVELTPEQKAAQAAEQAADAKIKAFEEAQTKKEKDAQISRDKSIIEGFKGDISNAIQKEKEKYEYCSYYGKEAEELAYEITLAVVKESKGADVITAEEAVQLAEQYFEEKDLEMSSLKKRQPKAPEASAATKEAERSRTVTPGFPTEEQPKPPVQRTRTLHSAATSSVAAARHTMNETREQKRERLMNALRNGKL